MSTTCKSLPTVTLIYRSKLSNNNNLTFLLWLTHYSAVELAKDAHIHLVQSTEVNTSKFLANIEEMFPRDIPIDNCMKEGNMSSLRSVAYRHMIVYNLS